MAGTVIFAIIASPALLLDYTVRHIERDFSVVIIVGLTAVEYTLFGADIIFFFIFIWLSANHTIKKLKRVYAEEGVISTTHN